MEIIIKCSNEELMNNEFSVFDKVIVTFENRGKVIVKNMLVNKKESTHFKDTIDLKFELGNYTDIQRRD